MCKLHVLCFNGDFKLQWKQLKAQKDFLGRWSQHIPVLFTRAEGFGVESSYNQIDLNDGIVKKMCILTCMPKEMLCLVSFSFFFFLIEHNLLWFPGVIQVLLLRVCPQIWGFKFVSLVSTTKRTRKRQGLFCFFNARHGTLIVFHFFYKVPTCFQGIVLFRMQDSLWMYGEKKMKWM